MPVVGFVVPHFVKGGQALKDWLRTAIIKDRPILHVANPKVCFESTCRSFSLDP